jgi:hypothetical protein
LPQQFDPLENLNPTRRGQYRFLVVLQHDRALSTGSLRPGLLQIQLWSERGYIHRSRSTVAGTFCS